MPNHSNSDDRPFPDANGFEPNGTPGAEAEVEPNLQLVEWVVVAAQLRGFVVWDDLRRAVVP